MTRPSSRQPERSSAVGLGGGMFIEGMNVDEPQLVFMIYSIGAGNQGRAGYGSRVVYRKGAGYIFFLVAFIQYLATCDT